MKWFAWFLFLFLAGGCASSPPVSAVLSPPPLPPGLPELPAPVGQVKIAAPRVVALPAPRSLVLTWSPVNWPGVQYVLYHSLDLTNWISLGRFVTNQFPFLATNSAEYFRVQSLDPNTLLVSGWATAQ